jgi:hypothetical protein
VRQPLCIELDAISEIRSPRDAPPPAGRAALKKLAEEFVRSIAKQLTDAGVEFTMPIPLDASLPRYGLSNRELTKRNIELVEWAPIMRPAYARGDVSMVSEAMDELLDRFHTNLTGTVEP